jgi:hypothetical protein
MATPCVGPLLGRHRPVTVSAAIPAKLAGNRAVGPAEPPGDLRLTSTAASHLGYNLTLFQGKMMGHRGDSVRKGLVLKTTHSNLPAMFSPRPVFCLFAIQL